MTDDQHVPQGPIPAAGRARFQEALDKAAQADWSALRDRAMQTRRTWGAAAADVTATDASPGPNDGEWNAWHVINHVGGFLQTVTAYLGDLRAAREVHFVIADQWLGDNKTVAEVCDECAQAWAAFEAELAATAAAPANDRSFDHPAGVTMTARQLVAMSGMHIADHAKQLRGIRGLPAPDRA